MDSLCYKGFFLIQLSSGVYRMYFLLALLFALLVFVCERILHSTGLLLWSVLHIQPTDFTSYASLNLFLNGFQFIWNVTLSVFTLSATVAAGVFSRVRAVVAVLFLGILMLYVYEYQARLFLEVLEEWNSGTGTVVRNILYVPSDLVRNVVQAILPLYNMVTWLGIQILRILVFSLEADGAGSFLGIFTSLAEMTKALVVGVVDYSKTFEPCETLNNVTVSSCYEPGLRQFDLKTPLTHLGVAVTHAMSFISSNCGALAGILNVILYPMTDPQFIQGAHMLGNAPLFAIFQVPVITWERSRNVQEGEVLGSLMSVPDMNPVFDFSVNGAKRIGYGLDNWLDMIALTIEELFGSAPVCPVATTEQDLANPDPDLFGSRETKVVALTDGMYAITDGISVEYVEYYRNVQRKVAVMAWPFEVDVRLGIAAVRYSEEDETDNVGSGTTAMMGCACYDIVDEDTYQGTRLELTCAILPYTEETSFQIVDYLLPTKFQVATTAGYATCDTMTFSVQSVRWPLTRVATPDVSTISPALSNQNNRFDSGDVWDRFNPNVVDAVIWATPRCDVSGSFSNYVCTPGFVDTGCFPYCMAARPAASGNSVLTFYNAVEWEENVQLMKRFCDPDATVYAAGRAPDDTWTAATVFSKGDFDGDGYSNSQAQIDSCVYNQEAVTIAKKFRVPGYEPPASVRLDNQPYVFAGDAAIFVDDENQELYVKRLYGGNNWHMTIDELPKRIPVNAPCRDIKNCPSNKEHDPSKTTVAEGFSANPGTATAAVATRWSVFHVVNPSADVYEAYFDWCRAIEKGVAQTAAFQITEKSSYGKPRVWRIDAFARDLGIVDDVPDYRTPWVVEFEGYEGKMSKLECTEKRNMSVVSISYVNELNVALTVLEASPAYFNPITQQAYQDAPGNTSAVSYVIYYMHTSTMQIRKYRLWTEELQGASINSVLCPELKRMPAFGSMLGETMIAVVEAVRMPVNALMSIPVLKDLEKLDDLMSCPTVTRGHHLLRECGTSMFSLDRYFEAVLNANSHFWMVFSYISAQLQGVPRGEYTRVLLNGMSVYYGHTQDVISKPLRQKAMKVFQGLYHGDSDGNMGGYASVSLGSRVGIAGQTPSILSGVGRGTGFGYIPSKVLQGPISFVKNVPSTALRLGGEMSEFLSEASQEASSVGSLLVLSSNRYLRFFFNGVVTSTGFMWWSYNVLVDVVITLLSTRNAQDIPLGIGWSKMYERRNDFKVKVTHTSEKACMGVMLMFGGAGSIAEASYAICSFGVYLADGFMDALMVLSVDYVMMDCMCGAPSGSNLREYTENVCLPNAPKQFSPAIRTAVGSLLEFDGPKELCTEFVSNANEKLLHSFDLTFASAYDLADASAGLFQQVLSWVPGEQGSCTGFYSSPELVTIMPVPMDYWRTCGDTMSCRMKCLDLIEAFEEAKETDDTFGKKVSEYTTTIEKPYINSNDFLEGRGNAPFEVLAMNEPSDCSAICGEDTQNDPETEYVKEARCLQVAGVDKYSRLEVVLYCVPSQLGVGMWRQGNWSVYGSEQWSADLVDVYFTTNVVRQDPISKSLAIPLLVVTKDGIYLFSENGIIRRLVRLMRGELYRSAAFETMHIVEEVLVYPGVRPVSNEGGEREAEVLVKGSSSIELISGEILDVQQCTIFSFFVSSVSFTNDFFSVSECTDSATHDPVYSYTSKGERVPIYITRDLSLVLFMPLVDSLPVVVCSAETSGFLVSNCVESTKIENPMTDAGLSGVRNTYSGVQDLQSGAVARRSKAISSTCMLELRDETSGTSQYGIFSAAHGSDVWFSEVRISLNSESLEAQSVIGQTTSRQPIVVTNAKDCTLRSCSGCNTIHTQKICYAAQQCTVSKCIGTPVNFRTPLCSWGGIIKEMVEASTSTVLSVWFAVYEVISLAVDSKTGVLQKQLYIEFPHEMVTMLACDAKDLITQVVASFTSMISSILFASKGSMDPSAFTSEATNEMLAQTTMATAAVTSLLSHLGQLPLYLLFSMVQMITCTVNDIAMVFDFTGKEVRFGSPETLEAFGSVGGQCQTLLVADTVEQAGTSDAERHLATAAITDASSAATNAYVASDTWRAASKLGQTAKLGFDTTKTVANAGVSTLRTTVQTARYTALYGYKGGTSLVGYAYNSKTFNTAVDRGTRLGVSAYNLGADGAKSAFHGASVAGRALYNQGGAVAGNVHRQLSGSKYYQAFISRAYLTYTGGKVAGKYLKQKANIAGSYASDKVSNAAKQSLGAVQSVARTTVGAARVASSGAKFVGKGLYSTGNKVANVVSLPVQKLRDLADEFKKRSAQLKSGLGKTGSVVGNNRYVQKLGGAGSWAGKKTFTLGRAIGSAASKTVKGTFKDSKAVLGSALGRPLRSLMMSPGKMSMHFLDAMMAWGIGLVRNIQDVIQAADREHCKLPDATAVDIPTCACGDDAAIIPEFRASMRDADGALWCQGTLDLVQSDGSSHIVFNPYTLTELRVFMDTADDFLECLSSGDSSTSDCERLRPTADLLEAQGADVMTVMTRCRSNYVNKQWDAGAAFIFAPELIQEFTGFAGTIIDGFDSSFYPESVIECMFISIERNIGNDACLDLFLYAIGQTADEYFTYDMLADTYTHKLSQTDACEVFTGPAKTSTVFANCVDALDDVIANSDDSEDSRDCELEYFLWSGRSSNKVPLATGHHKSYRNDEERWAMAETMVAIEKTRMQAQFDLLDDWDGSSLNLAFFTADGDGLHQAMDCMIMGPYAAADLWPGPSEVLGAYRYSRTAVANDFENLNRDFILPCGEEEDVGDDDLPPFTCGSAARKALMKTFVRDNLDLQEHIAQEVKAKIAELRSFWIDSDVGGCRGTLLNDDGTVSYTEERTFAQCSVEDVGEWTSYLDTEKTDTPINGDVILSRVMDEIKKFVIDGPLVKNTSSVLRAYYTSGGMSDEGDLDLSTDQLELLQSFGMYDPVNITSFYTLDEVLRPLSSSLADLCRGHTSQFMSTYPMRETSGDKWVLAGLEALESFDPMSDADYSLFTSKLEEIVHVFTKEAWYESPFYWSYVPRFVPSDSLVCKNYDRVHDTRRKGKITLDATSVPVTNVLENAAQFEGYSAEDVPAFDMFGFLSGTIGEVHGGSCVCEWNKAGENETCTIPSSVCDYAKTWGYAEVSLVCDSGMEYNIYLEECILELYTLLRQMRLEGVETPACLGMGPSDRWGMALDATNWTSGNSFTLPLSDIIIEGRGGMRIGSLISTSREWSSVLHDGIRVVPLVHPSEKTRKTSVAQRICVGDIPDEFTENDNLFTKRYIDELFPVAQAINESMPTAYCSRFAIELARKYFMEFLLSTGVDYPELYEQGDVVVLWRERCRSQMGIAQMCQIRGLGSNKYLKPLTTHGAGLHWARVWNHLNESIAETILNAVNAGLEQEFTGVIPSFMDGESFMQFMHGDTSTENAFNTRGGDDWRTKEGLFEADNCDAILDWWPADMEEPLGYHVSVPPYSDEVGYRGFDNGFIVERGDGYVYIHYEHSKVRNETLASNHYGASGYCGLHSAGMDMREVNRMRYCTRLSRDTHADPTVPVSPKGGNGVEYTESCGTDSRPVWDTSSSPLVRHGAGLLNYWKGETLVDWPPTDGLGQEHVEPMTKLSAFEDVAFGDSCPFLQLLQCDTDMDCVAVNSFSDVHCLKRCSLGVDGIVECGTGICATKDVECVSHDNCEDDFMCSGDGRCVRPVLMFSNELNEEINAQIFATTCPSDVYTESINMWGKSIFQDVENALPSLGMCSFRNWYEYRDLINRIDDDETCKNSAETCTIHGDHSFIRHTSKTEDASQGSLWHQDRLKVSAHACDRDYMHVLGLHECHPQNSVYELNGGTVSQAQSDVNGWVFGTHDESRKVVIPTFANSRDKPYYFMGTDKQKSDLYNSGESTSNVRPCSFIVKCAMQEFTVNNIHVGARYAYNPESLLVTFGGGSTTTAGLNNGNIASTREVTLSDVFNCGPFGLRTSENEDSEKACILDPAVTGLWYSMCGDPFTGVPTSCTVGDSSTSLCTVSVVGDGNTKTINLPTYSIEDRHRVHKHVNNLYTIFQKGVLTPIVLPSEKTRFELYTETVSCAKEIFTSLKHYSENYSPRYTAYTTDGDGIKDEYPLGLYFATFENDHYALTEFPFAWWVICTLFHGISPASNDVVPCPAWDNRIAVDDPIPEGMTTLDLLGAYEGAISQEMIPSDVLSDGVDTVAFCDSLGSSDAVSSEVRQNLMALFLDTKASLVDSTLFKEMATLKCYTKKTLQKNDTFSRSTYNEVLEEWYDNPLQRLPDFSIVANQDSIDTYNLQIFNELVSSRYIVIESYTDPRGTFIGEETFTVVGELQGSEEWVSHTSTNVIFDHICKQWFGVYNGEVGWAERVKDDMGAAYTEDGVPVFSFPHVSDVSDARSHMAGAIEQLNSLYTRDTCVLESARDREEGKECFVVSAGSCPDNKAVSKLYCKGANKCAFSSVTAQENSADYRVLTDVGFDGFQGSQISMEDFAWATNVLMGERIDEKSRHYHVKPQASEMPYFTSVSTMKLFTEFDSTKASEYLLSLSGGEDNSLRECANQDKEVRTINYEQCSAYSQLNEIKDTVSEHWKKDAFMKVPSDSTRAMYTSKQQLTSDTLYGFSASEHSSRDDFMTWVSDAAFHCSSADIHNTMCYQEEGVSRPTVYNPWTGGDFNPEEFCDTPAFVDYGGLRIDSGCNKFTCPNYYTRGVSNTVDDFHSAMSEHCPIHDGDAPQHSLHMQSSPINLCRYVPSSAGICRYAQGTLGGGMVWGDGEIRSMDGRPVQTVYDYESREDYIGQSGLFGDGHSELLRGRSRQQVGLTTPSTVSVNNRDIAGHAIRFHVDSRGNMRVDRMVLSGGTIPSDYLESVYDGHGDLEWLQNYEAILGIERDQVSMPMEYSIDEIGDGGLHWACPYRRLSHWGGYAQEKPTIPDPRRSNVMFSALNGGTGVNPMQSYEDSEWEEVRYYTANGVCICSNPMDCSFDIADNNPCSFTQSLESLYNRQYYDSIDLTPACSQHLDWPWSGGTLRDGSPARKHPTDPQCSLFDRLPKYRVRYDDKGFTEGLHGATTSSDGGDCHMGGLASGDVNAIETTCRLAHKNSTHMGFDCENGKHVEVEREKSKAPSWVLNNLKESRRKCVDADPLPTFKAGGTDVDPPSSFGQFMRLSPERYISGELARVACNALGVSQCNTLINPAKWTIGTFLKTLLTDPVTLFNSTYFTGNGSAHEEFVSTTEKEQLDDIVWKEPWVACKVEDGDMTCNGTISRKEWADPTKRGDACLRELNEANENDMAMDLEICNLDEQLAELCRQIGNMRSLVRTANCVAAGACFNQYFFYYPGTYSVTNDEFIHDSVRKFYLLRDGDSCPLTEAQESLIDQNNDVRYRCAASQLEPIVVTLEYLRLTLQKFVRIMYYGFMILIKFLEIIPQALFADDFSEAIQRIMEEILLYLKLILEEIKDLVDQFGNFVLEVLLRSPWGENIRNIIYELCKVVNSILDIIDKVICPILRAVHWFVQQVVEGLRKIRDVSILGGKPFYGVMNPIVTVIQKIVDVFGEIAKCSWTNSVPCSRVQLETSQQDGTLPTPTRCWTQYVANLGDENVLSCTGADTCEDEQGNRVVCDQCPIASTGVMDYGCDPIRKVCKCGVPVNERTQCTAHHQCLDDRDAQCSFMDSGSEQTFGTVPCSSCATRSMCLVDDGGQSGYCACPLQHTSFETCPASSVGDLVFIDPTGLCLTMLGAGNQRSNTFTTDYASTASIPCRLVEPSRSYCYRIQLSATAFTNMIVARDFFSVGGGRRLLQEPSPLVWNDVTGFCQELMLKKEVLGERGMSVTDYFAMQECAKWRGVAVSLIKTYNLTAVNDHFLLSITDFVHAFSTPDALTELVNNYHIVYEAFKHSHLAMSLHKMISTVERMVSIGTVNSTDITLFEKELKNVSKDILHWKHGLQAFADKSLIHRPPYKERRAFEHLHNYTTQNTRNMSRRLLQDLELRSDNTPIFDATVWSSAECPIGDALLDSFIVAGGIFIKHYNGNAPQQGVPVHSLIHAYPRIDQAVRVDVEYLNQTGQLMPGPNEVGKQPDVLLDTVYIIKGWGESLWDTRTWTFTTLSQTPSVFDKFLTCDVEKVVFCTEYKRSVLHSFIWVLLASYLISLGANALNLPLVSRVLFWGIPLTTLFYSLEYSPFCVPIIPGCVVDEIVDLIGHLIPTSVLIPNALQLYPGCLDGVPPPANVSFIHNASTNASCLVSCFEPPHSFYTSEAPFAWWLCDLDPGICEEFALWLDRRSIPYTNRLQNFIKEKAAIASYRDPDLISAQRVCATITTWYLLPWAMAVGFLLFISAWGLMVPVVALQGYVSLFFTSLLQLHVSVSTGVNQVYNIYIQQDIRRSRCDGGACVRNLIFGNRNC